MFRKLTIALVATAALGTAALTSSAAEAHWRGIRLVRHGYGYGHSYWNLRTMATAMATTGTSRASTATRAISTGTMPAGSGSARLLRARVARSQRAMKATPASCARPGLRSRPLLDRAALRRRRSDLHERIVDIAPAPAFRRIVAFDDRMAGGVEVRGGVACSATVAAADMTAGAAQPQMQPGLPVFRHSSQPSALGVTSWIWSE